MSAATTWSVKDGGRLCLCGHLKASHEEGDGFCIECPEVAAGWMCCEQFVDRALESVAA